MHRYRRAYADANSPLTPLTPLATDTFNFNIETGPSCSTLAVARSGPNSTGCSSTGRPKSAFQNTRETWGNTPGRICAATPKSCDSALQKLNSFTKLIAAFGSENIPTPVPPARRAIKQEPSVVNDSVPTIRLQPPPRKRRNSSIAGAGTKIKKEETFPTGGCTLGSGRQRNSTATSSSSAYFTASSFSASNSSIFSSTQQSQEMYDENDEQYLLPPRHFDRSNIRRSSPVMPKPLSPRFGEFLTRWGINCLKSIFERQEIDLQTFCCLTADDLELLGIQDPATRERVVAAINFIATVGINWGPKSCRGCGGCDD